MFALHLNPHLEGNVNTRSLKEEKQVSKKNSAVGKERVLSHSHSEATGTDEIFENG